MLYTFNVYTYPVSMQHSIEGQAKSDDEQNKNDRKSKEGDDNVFKHDDVDTKHGKLANKQH